MHGESVSRRDGCPAEGALTKGGHRRRSSTNVSSALAPEPRDQPMRLTLRTLLAWLDDTLPPDEVRQIGQQVNDGPFAKELVERIHRVSRQRRLTVPNTHGGDAT